MTPACGTAIPQTRLNSVDLPDPDGPSSNIRSPGSIASWSPRSRRRERQANGNRPCPCAARGRLIEHHWGVISTNAVRLQHAPNIDDGVLAFTSSFLTLFRESVTASSAELGNTSK